MGSPRLEGEQPGGLEKGDPETFRIIGAAMEVHRTLGCGFAEPVYQQAFAAEMRDRGIPFDQEKELTVSYKGHPLGLSFKFDFLAYHSVVVELKALSKLSPLEEAQLINYLKVGGLRKGLLLNFGARSLQYRRLVL